MYNQAIFKNRKRKEKPMMNESIVELKLDFTFPNSALERSSLQFEVENRTSS